MDSVTVNKGQIYAGQSPRDVDKESWRTLMREWRSFAAVKFEYDCRELARFIDQANEYEMWKVCGFDSLEDFIYRGLELDPETVTWAYEGLEIFGLDKPVPLSDAVSAAKANPLAGHGEIGNNRSRGDNVTSTRGNDQTYTLRRLARDNPELLERVASGDLSPNAAAIQAGFRRPTKSIPIDTPENAMKALLRVFTREQLLEALGKLEGLNK